jgi:hypothetical protein
MLKGVLEKRGLGREKENGGRAWPHQLGPYVSQESGEAHIRLPEKSHAAVVLPRPFSGEFAGAYLLAQM